LFETKKYDTVSLLQNKQPESTIYRMIMPVGLRLRYQCSHYYRAMLARWRDCMSSVCLSV